MDLVAKLNEDLELISSKDLYMRSYMYLVPNKNLIFTSGEMKSDD
jgi:hypothetical protein